MIGALLTPNDVAARRTYYSLAADIAAGGPTTVRAGSATTRQNGLVVDVAANTPRIWEGGLIVEPAVTSYVRASETFVGSGWNTTGGLSSSPSTDTGVANPRGVLSTPKFTEDTSTGAHQAFLIMGSARNQMSIFAKAGTRNWVWIRGGGGTNVWYDLTNGVVGTQSGGSVGAIESWGNGWYRCLWYNASGNASNIVFGLANADNVSSYTGDGSYAYFFGAQVSDGTQVWTSYVPTVGADVTRALDACSRSTTGWPTAKGQITFDFTPMWSVSAGGSNPGLTYRTLFDAQSALGGLAMTFVGGGDQIQVNCGTAPNFFITNTATWTKGTTYKMKLTWNGQTVSAYRDGASLGSNTHAGNVFSGWQANCYLGTSDGSTYGLNGTISNFKVQSL